MQTQIIYIMDFDDHKRHITDNKPISALAGFVAFKQVFSSDLSDSTNSKMSFNSSCDLETVSKFHRAVEIHGLAEHWGKLDSKLAEVLTLVEGTSLSEKLLPRYKGGSE